MKRGEVHFTDGCVPEVGTEGIEGCCLLCGYEWYKENCCGEKPCPCMAMAERWQEVSYKNIILLITYHLGRPYGYFWEKWYS